jgi:hypothetical protein
LFATTGSSDEKLSATGVAFNKLSDKIQESTSNVWHKSKAISAVLNQLLGSMASFADTHNLEIEPDRVPPHFQDKKLGTSKINAPES